MLAIAIILAISTILNLAIIVWLVIEGVTAYRRGDDEYAYVMTHDIYLPIGFLIASLAALIAVITQL